MAYFDRKDIEKSFAKAVLDSAMDCWSFEGDEWQKCVMEINGICLYEQIIADMKAEDEEMEKRKQWR